MAGKREALAKIFDSLGFNKLGRLTDNGAQVLVLNYHRIGDPDTTPFDRDIFSATPEEFADQLDYLDSNFDVVSLDEAVKITTQATTDSRQAVSITFDDGYADNATLAAPMLADRGMPAAFFLATNFLDDDRLAWWDEIAWIVRHATVDSISLPAFGLSLDLIGAARRRSIRVGIEGYKRLPPALACEFLDALADAAGCGRCPKGERDGVWMSWDQAREIREMGMTIGGHTMSHPVLSTLSIDSQRDEITGCRDRIANEIGEAPKHFSYPVGQPESFTVDTRHLIQDAGFETAFAFYGGVWRTGHFDGFNIPRVAVERMHRGPLFRARTSWPTVFVGGR